MRHEFSYKKAFFTILFFITGIPFFIASLSPAAIMPAFERADPFTAPVQSPTAVATDMLGTLYVTDLSGGTLHAISRAGRYMSIAGLDKPVSVAVDRNGRIYVGSKGRGSVQVFDKGLNLLFELGKGRGEFQQPNAIATDSSGKIYVVDSMEDRVKVYRPDGSFKYLFGSSGSGEGQFHFPTSIAINENTNEILVVDRKMRSSMFGAGDGARVQIFTLYGRFKSSFEKYGILIRPMGMTIDQENRIYITDTLQNGVQVFDGEGAYLGAVYDKVNPMRTPLGISLSSGNKLYVASLNTGSVEVYVSAIPGPEITVIPESYDFGGIGVGGVSETMLIVRNDGAEELDIGSVSNPSSPFSKTSDGCTNTTLNPSDNCTITVLFAPDQETAYADILTIASNDPDEGLLSVALSGEGRNNEPSSDAGGPYTAQEGQLIVFDGTGSDDLDGTITLYEWDVDGDGLYDYASSQARHDHIYSQQGTYTIRLRVTDNRGATGVAETVAAISDTAPSADFTGIPTAGDVPLAVVFTDASTGYDEPLSYAWDFNNDGITDSMEKVPSYVYVSEGAYTVRLTVTDADGSISSLTRLDYILAGKQFSALDVNIDGKGSVTAAPYGISCPGDCSSQYVQGTGVVLTAETANSDWTFSGWSGACSGTGSCLLIMDGNKTVTAHFECSIHFSDTIPVWAEEYIMSVSCEGIMPGYEDTTFRATDMVTRADMAAFIIRAIYGEDFEYSGIPYFDDVPESHELFRYIQRLNEEEITHGCSETSYCPDNTVNRAQMATFLIRALYSEAYTFDSIPYFTDVQDTHWAFSYIQKLYEDDVSSGYGDGTYRPSIKVNRAQMATYLWRTFLRKP